MKTIICDIDGTLTNLWPIEKAILLRLIGAQSVEKIEQLKNQGCNNYMIYCKVAKCRISKKKYISLYNDAFLFLEKEGSLPLPQKYLLVDWILKNRQKYTYVYATGGQRSETLYILRQLRLLQYFDVKNSIDKTTCRFAKKTGIPFQKIAQKYEECLLITDSRDDCSGAVKAGIPYYLVKPNQKILNKKPLLNFVEKRSM